MTFVPNRRLARELERSPELAAVKKAAAEEIAREAERNVRQIGRPDVLTPWMGRKGHSEIEVVIEGNDVFVENTDHAAHLQEWGSVNNPPHAPLRRAVRQAGYRLDEQQDLP